MADRAVLDLLATTPLFADLPADLRAILADHLVPMTIQGGDVLMREGDEADALYLVVAGRLQARVGDGDATTVVGEIGRGEVVGESALLTDQPRFATVVALRDTELLQLPLVAFEDIVASHPTFLRPVAAQVIGRMMRAQAGAATDHPVATVAVVPIHGRDTAVRCARALADALPAVAGHGVVVTREDRPQGQSEVAWAQQLEADHALVVYLADVAADDSTRRCLRQADTVLLVADATERADVTPVEAVLAEHRRRVNVPVELVLVHPARHEIPTGTRRWLEVRDLRRHHHVRVEDADDVARVARLVTDRAIGLVLSGGGARGMAEIGVVKAMGELGIPIDAVGGTSAGSLVAGAVARGWTADAIARTLRRGMVEASNPVDVTVPVASLAAGRRISERLKEAAGEVDIEDLWIDYFCVSTNLSRVRPEIHRRGVGWRAIRASMSIPGIFPPVAHNGDVLVDGGLVDNLPVAEMRRGHDGITVVAVDVGVHRGLAAGDLPDSTVVDGWRLVLDRVNPRRPTPEVVGILTVLARLTELGGGTGDEGADLGDVLIRPDVERFPILDFSRFDELVEIGYREGLEVLSDWRATP